MANERKSRCGSARFVLLVLLGLPFHRAGGRIRRGGLRFALLCGANFLGHLAPEFVRARAPALQGGIEHFQGAATGVDLVVMSEIGEALKDAKQLLVPGPTPDLHVAGAALRTEWPEPRQLVAALPSRVHAEA